MKPVQAELSDSSLKLDKENEHQARFKSPLDTHPTPFKERVNANLVPRENFDALSTVVHNLVEEIEKLKKQLAAIQVTAMSAFWSLMVVLISVWTQEMKWKVVCPLSLK